MKQGAVLRFHDIYHTSEENPGNSQLRDRLIKVVRPVIDSNEVPYLQMTSTGSKNVRDEEEMKEDKDGQPPHPFSLLFIESGAAAINK